MKILYGVLSQGQGHLNRAAALIALLRARGHRVSIVTSGETPPDYAQKTLGPFTHVPLPGFVLSDGVVRRRATLTAFARSVPSRTTRARALARTIADERVDLVITDFEPIAAWAARIAGAPCVGVAGQYRITRTDALAPPEGPLERWTARAVMEAWTPPLQRYFAVSFTAVRPTRARTDVVWPIVDAALSDRRTRRDGFVLAYLYAYPEDRVVRALSGHGVSFRVYGLGERPATADVTFAATGREPFLDDLATCDAVILNGSFQGVCEAAALGKRILSIPFGAQFEERFNAYQVERAGLGACATALTREAVAAFVSDRASAARTPLPDGAAQVAEALGL